ncbi:MAG: hypothetical protein Q8L37_01165 [Candidatus Gottesmanbacteria bacterium]|nr:hypothetical protein [Candidatus Gottesmanbacteria bacterium]
MILNKTILILEDDLLTFSILLRPSTSLRVSAGLSLRGASEIQDRLSTIEQDQPYDFSVT